MRDIRFRAWDKINKKMFHLYKMGFLQEGDDLTLVFDDRDSIYIDDYFSNTKQSNFIPMQYTGLKDKNGKEIYEGDIVTRPEKKTIPQEINFESGCFIIGKLPVPPSLLCNYNDQIEVIGNIYENPELLENSEGEE